MGVALVRALYWTEYGEMVQYGLNQPAFGIEDYKAMLLEALGTAVLLYVGDRRGKDIGHRTGNGRGSMRE